MDCLYLVLGAFCQDSCFDIGDVERRSGFYLFAPNYDCDCDGLFENHALPIAWTGE